MNDTCLLIIISYNQLSYTRACVHSVLENTAYPYHLLIIDNGSHEETCAYLRGLQDRADVTVVFNTENQGWIGGVNQGLSFGDYAYYCVMNNDIIVYPGWLGEMVTVARSHGRIGLVSPCWEVPSRYQEDHQRFFQAEVVSRKGQWVETDWMRGFCFLIRRDVVRAIGGLDPAYGAGYYDDWDYSVRAVAAGYLCARALGAFVYHCKNITFTGLMKKFEYDANFSRNKAIFYNRWGRPLRILVIYTPDLDKRRAFIQDVLRRLLRDQNNLFLWHTGTDPLIHHTNCVSRPCSVKRLKWRVLGHLLDNYRRALRKHYNVILCSRSMARRLRAWPGIPKAYPVVCLEDLPEARAFEEVRRFKMYR